MKMKKKKKTTCLSFVHACRPYHEAGTRACRRTRCKGAAWYSYSQDKYCATISLQTSFISHREVSSIHTTERLKNDDHHGRHSTHSLPPYDDRPDGPALCPGPWADEHCISRRQANVSTKVRMLLRLTICQQAGHSLRLSPPCLPSYTHQHLSSPNNGRPCSTETSTSRPLSWHTAVQCSDGWHTAVRPPATTRILSEVERLTDHTEPTLTTHSSLLHLSSLTLLLATIPYSLFLLEPLNKLLEAKDAACAFSDADYPPTEREEVGFDYEHTTHWLVDRWATVNLGRAVMSAVAAGMAIWAGVEGVKMAGVRVVSGGARMGL